MPARRLAGVSTVTRADATEARPPASAARLAKRIAAGEPPLGRARRVGRMLRTLAATHPDAHCELDFRTPLELAVATVLSAQSTDKLVNTVTPALFARYRTALDYAEADRAELEEMIHSTGFFRNKANSLIGLGAAVVERHDGVLPHTLDELVTLPGIGRKTANVILGNAFDVPGHHRRHPLRPAGPALGLDRRRRTRSRSSTRSGRWCPSATGRSCRTG